MSPPEFISTEPCPVHEVGPDAFKLESYSPKPRLWVSVSGGRTSAFMAKWCKDNLSDQYEIRFGMANTSWEDEDTLRFAEAVDRHFGLNLVLIEAVVHPGERKSCTHRVVTFETASRNGEVFESAAAKYGLPNKTFKWCTRELKLNAMKSYQRSIGWMPGTFKTAIGIRADEMRRVSDSAEAQNTIYPLVDMIPTDKEDVLAFFEDFEWDLRIAEHNGNCRRCFQKSDRKLHTGYREDPRSFDFPIRLDQLYRHVGPNNVPGPRQMYRGRRSATALVAEFQRNDYDASKGIEDGGCSESCEAYETEQMDMFREAA